MDLDLDTLNMRLQPTLFAGSIQQSIGIGPSHPPQKKIPTLLLSTPNKGILVHVLAVAGEVHSQPAPFRIW